MEENQNKTFIETQKKLTAINVSGLTEKKESGKDRNGNKNYLDYLSWSYAWGELLKVCPTASYEIERFGEKNEPFLRCGEGYMVFTKVTVDGVTREMWLPVMNGNNAAVKEQAYKYSTSYGEKSVAPCDMTDINKAIMRCLVKNIAMFGLGLNIYQGEDLPNVDEPSIVSKESEAHCERCGKEIANHGKYSKEFIISRSMETYGKRLCYDCSVEMQNKKGE